MAWVLRVSHRPQLVKNLINGPTNKVAVEVGGRLCLVSPAWKYPPPPSGQNRLWGSARHLVTACVLEKPTQFFLLLCWEKLRPSSLRVFLLCFSFLCVSFITHTERSALTLLAIKCVFFLPRTKQFCTTPAGCPAVYLDSDTIYLETVSGPMRLPPLQMPVANS